jgi:hypothetical protein
MTLQEIETALGQRLANISPALRIAWPNKDADLALPYVEFLHAPVSLEDNTLDSTGKRRVGLALLTVVSREDQFSTEANGIVAAIEAQFPRGLRLSVIGKGDVLIRRWPEAVAPFQDGTHWRQPVRISYETEET